MFGGYLIMYILHQDRPKYINQIKTTVYFTHSNMMGVSLLLTQCYGAQGMKFLHQK